MTLTLAGRSIMNTEQTRGWWRGRFLILLTSSVDDENLIMICCYFSTSQLCWALPFTALGLGDREWPCLISHHNFPSPFSLFSLFPPPFSLLHHLFSASLVLGLSLTPCRFALTYKLGSVKVNLPLGFNGFAGAMRQYRAKMQSDNSPLSRVIYCLRFFLPNTLTQTDFTNTVHVLLAGYDEDGSLSYLLLFDALIC